MGTFPLDPLPLAPEPEPDPLPEPTLGFFAAIAGGERTPAFRLAAESCERRFGVLVFLPVIVLAVEPAPEPLLSVDGGVELFEVA
jgi:hypothetical protein